MITASLLRFLTVIGTSAGLVHAEAKFVQTYEAENAVLIGKSRVAHELPDGTGRAYVTGLWTPADGVDFAVNVPAAGIYSLSLGYACDPGKFIPIYVNGRAQGSRLFPKTVGFAEETYGRIPLAAGDNTIRIGADWGYADIEFIRLSAATEPVAFNLRKTPVNPRASLEARQLFTTLTHAFGHKTLSGQHESNPLDPTRLNHIDRLTDGTAPAILGLDLMFYSPAWTQADGDGAIEQARDWALRRHGIVTLSWHWLSPAGATGQVWDSFSTNKTTFDVSRLSDETSSEYLAVIRDLDHVAEKLKVLRDAGVPVLWRPLHEAEGGWFWWGARGPAATKHLYDLMFDRFTRVHRLDNLLWVWTTTDNPDALAWYPGDDRVDIIANDLYAPAGTQGDFFTVFDQLRERYGGRKPIALGECGVLPTMSARAPWLWFLAWDDFIGRVDANPAAFVTQTYGNSRVITLSRLPDLQAQPAFPRKRPR